MNRVFSRRLLARGLLGAWALQSLSACSNPAVQLLTQQRLTLGRAQLQAALDRRFPLEQRVADVLDVRMSAPQLSLLPARSRLAAALQIDLTERLLQTTHPARLALDFGLRFQASDRTVRLRDVRVQELVFTQLPPAYQALMNRSAPPLAERALDGLVMHQISPEDWNSLQRLGLEPGEFSVTPQGLTLDFRPAGRSPR